MPRSRRVRSDPEEEEDEDSGDDAFVVEEEEAKPSPAKRGRRLVVEEEYDDEDEEEGEETQDVDQDIKMDVDEEQVVLTLQSQAPEASQNIPKPKDGEVSKFLKLGEDRREKAISDVSRLVLFKCMSGEPIERLKIAKEAAINEDKVSNAVFDEVNQRLDNIFGFQLKQAPRFISNVQGMPTKCKERFYMYNGVEDPSGGHMRAIHQVDGKASIEKGLLMCVLGFIFCKGTARNDGSRWLLDKELYRLLNNMDENLPEEPPAQGSTRQRHQVDGVPDVDGALDRFVKMDYLWKVKADENLMAINEQAEETSWFYTMSARAAVEIGRLNVVHFVASTRKLEPHQQTLNDRNSPLLTSLLYA